jgi:hypothetical protein
MVGTCGNVYKEEEMPAEFEPIRILPITEEDKKRVKKEDTSSTKNHYVIPFRLSAEPPQGWPEIFAGVWKASGGGVQAWLKGEELRLVCPLENVSNVLPVLKSAVASANERHQNLLNKKAAEEADARKREEEAKQAEGRAIDAALDKLDFS